AALNHPNILSIHDTGEHRGVPYAVTELLEGENLSDRLRSGPVAPKRATEIACQIADGLAAAHARRVIHRDIKPENIFLTKDGPHRDPPAHLPPSGEGPRRPLSGGARSAPRSSRVSSRADARSRRARPVPRRAAVEAPPHSGPAPRDGRSPSVPARDLRRFVLAARADGRFAGGILFGARRLPSLTG